MCDYNLLVSCSWGDYSRAREEILKIFCELGDEKPFVKRTAARGIIGVRTRMDSREVIRKLRELFDERPPYVSTCAEMGAGRLLDALHIGLYERRNHGAQKQDS